MSKPEDIPQDVWDRSMEVENAANDAYALSLENPKAPVGSAYEASLGVIARAILAAKAEERQQCINVVLGFIQYGGDTHHGVTVNPMADAMEVAKAIRERGKANVSTARKSEIEGV